MRVFERDLVDIRELLKKETLPEKNLFDTLWEKELSLAFCTLLSGNFGRYEYGKLKPAAAAMELLNLAVGRHYYELQDKRPIPKKVQVDLALISGDYYYAKAIILVVPLGKEVVRIGANAIAKVSEGEITDETTSPTLDFQRFCDKIRLRSALYSASFELGCLLGDVISSLSHQLSRLGECLGALTLLNGAEKVLPEWRSLATKSFQEESLKILDILPKGNGRDTLHGYVTKRYEPFFNEV